MKMLKYFAHPTKNQRVSPVFTYAESKSIIACFYITSKLTSITNFIIRDKLRRQNSEKLQIRPFFLFLIFKNLLSLLETNETCFLEPFLTVNPNLKFIFVKNGQIGRVFRFLLWEAFYKSETYLSHFYFFLFDSIKHCQIFF